MGIYYTVFPFASKLDTEEFWLWIRESEAEIPATIPTGRAIQVDELKQVLKQFEQDATRYDSHPTWLSLHREIDGNWLEVEADFVENGYDVDSLRILSSWEETLELVQSIVDLCGTQVLMIEGESPIK